MDATSLVIGLAIGVVIGPYCWLGAGVLLKRAERWYLNKVFERMWGGP